MREGKIDLAKWDALVPNRTHAAIVEDITEPVEREVEEDIELQNEAGELVRFRRTRTIKSERVIGTRVVREAFVEERQHDVMHKFAAMLEDGFDPRDPDNLCARMKADGAVPGLLTETEWREPQERGDKPDTGTMVTRTFLALDNLAVAFAGAMERIAALEGQVGEVSSAARSPIVDEPLNV